MALLGDFLPNTGWDWVTHLLAQAISIVGFIFILIAVALVIIGISKTSKIAKESKLKHIVPLLQEMDTLLRKQAYKETNKPYDKEEYLKLNFRISAEIFGFEKDFINRMMNVKTKEEAFLLNQQMQTKMIQKYGTNKPNWFKSAKPISGALDWNGYGLKDFRAKGKYRRLLNKLSQCRIGVADEQLNEYIRKHIENSEILNNLLIVHEREKDFTASSNGESMRPTSFLPLPLTSSFSNFEQDVSERMETLRVNISKRVSELEKQNGK